MPKTLGIIGAGAVGVEFASIFKRFGSKVTVLEMLPRIVPVEDEEVSKELDDTSRSRAFASRPAPRPRTSARRARACKLTATLANGKKEEMEFDCLLIAVGRKPNTDNIGLENTKVELDRGFIKVERVSTDGRTGVYAIGDIVAGTPQLAHVATMEGMVALDHMTGKPCDPINRNRIPGATYTEPGIGSVGIDRSAGEGAGIRGEGRQVSVRRQTARPPSLAATMAL